MQRGTGGRKESGFIRYPHLSWSAGNVTTSSGWHERQLVLALSPHATVRLSQTAITLFLILFLGAAFRFYDLDRWSLWTDELISWRVAASPRILSQGIPDDEHPPLYYLLMHQMRQLGDGEAWLRLPSAVAGFLTIPIVYQIGALMNKREWGLLSAALVATSPLLIWYSREARMYGLASLLWALSLFFYFRLLVRNNWWETLGFALATFLGILTTYSTLGLWGIEICAFWLAWLLSGKGIKRLVRWLLSQALIAGGLLWWWPFMQTQLGRRLIIYYSLLPALGFDVTGTLAEMVVLASAAASILLAAGILVALIFAWKPSALAANRGLMRSLLIGTLLVLVLATVLGAIPRGLSIRRQLLVFYLPLILIGAWSLLHFSWRRLAFALTAMSFLLALVSATTPAVENWRGVSNMIAGTANVKDRVLLAPSWTKMAFDYYYKGDSTYSGADSRGFAVPDSPPPESGEHVWLVQLDNYLTREQTAAVTAWFQSNAEVLSTRRFSRDILVIEYIVR